MKMLDLSAEAWFNGAEAHLTVMESTVDSKLTTLGRLHNMGQPFDVKTTILRVAETFYSVTEGLPIDPENSEKNTMQTWRSLVDFVTNLGVEVERSRTLQSSRRNESPRCAYVSDI
jgi:hypothetical protein